MLKIFFVLIAVGVKGAGKICIGLCLLLIGVSANGQRKPAKEWLDQKYSMFIHWGLYSELGGIWDGKPVVSGYSEQIQSHGGIFSDWYADVAARFDPRKWNADSIVSLAKAAGMRSIIFTSKHHDGFCMYHSRYTDYNIVDATPFKRDVMKELSEACFRQGVRFGVYFSLIDWHFPQAYPISSHNADFLTPEHYAYNLKQVEELMTEYGDISEIWFDMGSLTLEQSRGLYQLVDSLQPLCMISGRLGNDCSDFSVMGDNEYPDHKMGVPWQTAASFFDETWGYRSWQERGKIADKVNEKLLSLIKVVSHGGNYLLNIGPAGDGSVVPFEREVLLKMGVWLQKYGEALYAAEANPFDRAFQWGNVTLKGNNLYLFIDNSRMPEAISLDGLRGRISDAYYVGGGKVKFAKENGEWKIYPGNENSFNSPVTVVRIEIAEGFRIEPVHRMVKDRILTPQNAEPLYAYSSIDYYTGFQSMVAYNWGVVHPAKQIQPAILYTEQDKGKEIRLSVDGEARNIVLKEGKLQPLKHGNVSYGKTYMKPSGSVFGRRPVEGGFVDTEGDEWKEYPLRMGEKMSAPAVERTSILLLQEIESDRDADMLIGIGSGNGLQVMLNGEYLTIHFSGWATVYNKELVLLPLKKGKNQLLLKLYNRFEKEHSFSIDPEVSQVFYKKELEPFNLGVGKWHDISVRLATPPASNTAMRLNNLKITL